MADSRHQCYDSNGTWCGACSGTFLDASCCTSFTETYSPDDGGMPRSRCSGNKLGNNVEIAVMTGADGSKTAENAGELLFSRVLIPFTLLGVAIYVGIKVLEKNLPELS